MPTGPISLPGSAARAAAAYGAVALGLGLARAAPSFAFLGDRGELFGWLAYATAVTAAPPAAVLGLGFRRPLSEWGLGWGRSRRDALWIGLALAGAVAFAWALSRAPEIRAYYPHDRLLRGEPLRWIPTTLAFAAHGLAWEAAFRGALVIGVTGPPASTNNTYSFYREVDLRGALAVLAQTALYAVGHLGKPPIEVALSIPAGLVLGFAALRTRSVLPGFLVHFTLSTSVNLFCVYG